MTKTDSTKSVRTQDFDNLAATTKSIMRLCAFAMVSNGVIDPSEANVIANIIVRRYISRDLEDLNVLLNKVRVDDFAPESADRAHLAGLHPEILKSVADHELAQRKFECAYMIVAHICEQLNNSATRKSIFMNLDSLDEGRLKREVMDMQLVARADQALLDSEREAFRVFCKCARITHSTRLWQRLQNYPDEILWGVDSVDFKITQKTELDVNDYRSIRKSVDFYDIQGPIVDGAGYLLQRELTRHHDMMYHKDKAFNACAFILFCATALITYLKISHHSLLDFINSQIVIIKDMLMPKLSTWHVPAAFFSFVILCLGVYLISRKIKLKRNMRSFTLTRAVCVAVSSVLVIISLYSNQICLLVMMLAIEWLMFMKEQLGAHRSKTIPSMTVMVAAAIIADMSLGVIEYYAHNSTGVPNFIYIIASSLFLGCICFFFGKWLENRREQAHVDQEDMGKCVNGIMKNL